MRFLALLACSLVAFLVALPARADTQVELLDTWPAGDAVTLHRNQNFYLHLHYTSDEPVHIWARPYFQGKPVHAGSNPSRIYPAGSGEALGWFFLDPDAQVDEVRIRAGDGSPRRTHVVATFPISVTASDAPAQTTASPGWVDTLRAADKAVQDAEYQAAMNKPVTAGEILFFNGFMLAMAAIGVLGFAWPAWGLWRWRGPWRLAAVIPAAIMSFVVLRLIVGTSIDPTSHNLWPFEILQAGVLSLVIMAVLAVARRIVGVRRAA